MSESRNEELMRLVEDQRRDDTFFVPQHTIQFVDHGVVRRGRGLRGSVPHGTTTGYGHFGCRCVRCRDAHAISQRRLRISRRGRIVPEHVHGSANGYTNYDCRCDLCRDAWRHYKRERRSG